MRFLYVGIDPVDFGSESFRQDVLNKFSGVRQLGNEVDYICRDESEIVSVAGSVETRTSYAGSRSPEREFFRYVLAFLESRVYDFLYMRSRLIYPEQVRIAEMVKTKKFGAKVIYEPACWPVEPYFREKLRWSRGANDPAKFARTYKEMMCQRIRAADLSGLVDASVIFGLPVHTVWGIPAIAESNGVSVGQVRMRSSCETLESPITMLAVVDDSYLCGYDRLFRGLDAYRKHNFREQVTLDIVGSEADTEELCASAAEWNVGDCVRFLGAKNIGEINDLCNTHTVAVSSLGLYRADRIYYSPFLTKLFCAAGIPFLYAYEDIGLGTKVPFALKMPNLDAPINMELVGEFVWRCRFNAGLAQQERRFAEKHYDWRVIMKQILLFTATGKLEA